MWKNEVNIDVEIDITLDQVDSNFEIISRNNGSKQPNNTRKRFKHDRSARKRSKSFSGCGPINPKPVLPTKFLLGGNINDPLNLNSLQDDEINRAMNAVTPKSSPLPTPPRRKMPVEVIVSPNTHDPLHLMDGKNDKEYEEHLSTPVKKCKKRRVKKRRTMSASAEGCIPDNAVPFEARTPEATEDSARIPECPEILANDTNETITIIDGACNALTFDLKEKSKPKSEDCQAKKFKSFMDKIVSPVIPQPGAWLKRSNSIKISRPRPNKPNQDALPTFKEGNKKFQYGNYNRYYGYRNPHNETDPRLKVFYLYPDLFHNRDILDVGCNIGHITLSVARDFNARTVTGIDIDPKLISIARKNIKYYVKTADTTPTKLDGTPGLLETPTNERFHKTQQERDFPKNVSFKQCNYVLEDESLLALEEPQYDVILCLSITKWIHLNWGDRGLKLTFRRMYEQLRPGGKLILEPQPWHGYKSKKKLTEKIFENFNSIELLPDKFSEYLLSPAVGFAKSEILGFPQHRSVGFRRPIQVFTKSTMFPSERIEVTPKVDHETPLKAQSVPDKQEMPTSAVTSVNHVYTNLLQPTPSYSACSEENNENRHQPPARSNPNVSDTKNTDISEQTDVVRKNTDNTEQTDVVRFKEKD
ncbi:unnamed protein product [Ceutorhynchus assimilis]|uniref:RNA methyltransferase n=1 Tax=Ceutorhynchus assimilis TaxID=467358 RepID=A0A9P0DJI6_9CUCU|nr:unnamed protein product [Ceutorhynchus assimilis]